MSFLVVHPDGSESNFASLEEVFADERKRVEAVCDHNFVKFSETAPGSSTRTDYYNCEHCGKVKTNEVRQR